MREHFKYIDHANFLVVDDMNAMLGDNSLKSLFNRTHYGKHTGERFPGASSKGTEASDHYPVFIEPEVGM